MTNFTSPPVRMIILKGDEVAKFEELLDAMPHGHAKKLIHLVNQAQLNRMAEQPQAKESKEHYGEKIRSTIPVAPKLPPSADDEFDD
jgi:hypothetical protein